MDSAMSQISEIAIASTKLASLLSFTRRLTLNKTRNTTYCKIPLLSWLYAAAILEICTADEFAGLKVARQVAFGQLTI